MTSSVVRKVHSYLQAIIPDEIGDNLIRTAQQYSWATEANPIIGYASILVYLISNNLHDNTAQPQASEYLRKPENMHVLRCLLSIEAPTIDALAERVFVDAVVALDSTTVEATLLRGVSPNIIIKGMSDWPLTYVCGYENVPLAQILLKGGADVNAPPAHSYGWTALQATSERGNIELVQLLLQAGADVNAPPAFKQGRTALQAASKKGNIELVQLLLQAGADVNAPPAYYQGRTALQTASENGNIELVQLLLQEGADVNAPPAHSYGWTAF
jgi:ankyrin repeat protein